MQLGAGGIDDGCCFLLADDVQQHRNARVRVFERQSARDAVPVICANIFGGNGAAERLADVRVVVDDGGGGGVGIGHGGGGGGRRREGGGGEFVSDEKSEGRRLFRGKPKRFREFIRLPAAAAAACDCCLLLLLLLLDTVNFFGLWQNVMT